MEIRNCTRLNKGKGLYSLNEHNCGDIIYILSGSITNIPSKYTIHIGNGKHILDKYGSYMNHSNDANTKIVGLSVIATKKININDEVTFDYNESELTLVEPFYSEGIYVCGNNNY